jgi:Flp pilus assembly protein TadD
MRDRSFFPWAAGLLVLALAAPPAAFADADVAAPPVNNADFDLGAEAIKSKSWDEAIKHLDSAARTLPANADVQNLLGYAYRNQRKFELAFKHYGEALRLDPQHRGTHEYIGEAYVLVGDKAKAQQHLAALERICGKGCEQYQDLARAIAQGK